MRIQRLLGILCVLANVEKITVQELADKFEVSKRTIFRDLESLNGAGIPIMSYLGTGGGISIVSGYKVDKRVLSTADAYKLYTALNGLKSIDGDTSVTNLIAKLVPGQENAVLSQSQYVINLSSWFSDSVIKEKMEVFRQAIYDRKCVCIEYISKQSRTKRIIDPHKLIFKQSDWYVYAFCHKRRAFRLFKLRRIAAYHVTSNLFEPHMINYIDLDADYANDLFSTQYSSGSVRVILEYNLEDEFFLTQKIDATFLKKELDQSSQMGQICFYTTDLSAICDLVFGLLDKVKVVSPPELLDMVKCKLNTIKDFYER